MTMVNKTIRAIGYTRVSTRDQGENGAGHDLQMSRIEGFARAAGYGIVRTFRDDHTGAGEDSAKERKGLRGAIELSWQRKWPIIVDGFDRLSRNTKTVEEMVINSRLKVISAKNGEGVTHAVIMGEAARAQEEVERISRTTKEGLARARERGVTLGNTKNLDEAQRKGAASNKAKADQQTRELAPVVKEICTLRTSGMVTKETIANELNTRGYRTARNGRWNKDNVRRLLDRIAELERFQERERQSEQPRNNPQWGIF